MTAKITATPALSTKRTARAAWNTQTARGATLSRIFDALPGQRAPLRHTFGPRAVILAEAKGLSTLICADTG